MTALLLLLSACLPSGTDNVTDLASSGLLDQAEYITVPFVQQSTDYTCGLACLVSVLQYWKQPASENDILSRTPPDSRRTGYSVGELKRIAKDRQAQAFAMIGTTMFLEQQVKKGRPVIVPLQMPYNRYRLNFVREIPIYGKFFAYLSEQFVPSFSHFVTVFAVTPQTVWVMDPMFGAKPIPKNEFTTMWQAKKNALLLVAAT